MISLLYRLVVDDDEEEVVAEEVTVAGVVDKAFSSNVVDAVSASADVSSAVSPVVEDIDASASIN